MTRSSGIEPDAPIDNRIDRLRIRHLRLLELVERTGSLTAAADTLHISQPGATKMLQDLETAFGCRLVDRGTRGGRLNVAGAQALERLRVALGALRAAAEAMRAMPEVPLVRIGMLPLAGVTLIPRLVARLRASGTMPRLVIEEGAVALVLGRLRAGEIDCVIGRIDRDTVREWVGQLDVTPLADERLDVACAVDHPLAQARQVGLDRLLVHRWVMPPRSTYTRQQFDAAFIAQGRPPPEPWMESASFHTNLATVAGSDLLTVAPQSAVAFYAALGKVRCVRLDAPFPHDSLVFVTLRSADRIAAVEAIKAGLGALAAAEETPSAKRGKAR